MVHDHVPPIVAIGDERVQGSGGRRVARLIHEVFVHRHKRKVALDHYVFVGQDHLQALWSTEDPGI